MKKKIITTLLIVSVIVLSIVGLISCGEKEGEKLATPVVTLNGDVATWQADPNAVRFELSLGSSVLKVSNTTTSKQLSSGVSFKVRAVGDGENYLTSDWSNEVTYTPQMTAEPQHVATTLGELKSAKVKENVIYEVTATWSLKDGGNEYGNGWLTDENNNQVVVYGLCKDSSVLSWTGYAYEYTNDKSYGDSSISDGDTLTVGMVYNPKYDNFNCYLIEIVKKAEDLPGTVKVNFVMINDTHGAFTDSSEGNSVGRVDTLIQDLEEDNGDYIFIHNGDAFQGSFVSGETHGLVLIEAFNAMELDCFVIGNHEFDWGIDKIAQYADGNSANGEANFPFLGANIFYEGTTNRPDWIDEYAIVEQDGVKVGIIGLIGYGQESSILTRHVKDYDFGEPLPIVRRLSTELREQKGCDVVVVATHSYSSPLNRDIANLVGSSRVDAIFCAHSHQNINESEIRTDGKKIPVVQCYDKNDNASEVVLKVDAEKTYYGYSSLKHEPENYAISARVQALIDKYQYLINESQSSLGNTPNFIDKDTLGEYATDALINYEYTGYNFGDVDVSIINTGGVRANIDAGEITKADVFEVFPFNNAVVLVNMNGALLKSLCSQNANFFYIDVSASLGSYNDLSDNATYQLAVIDYVFEGTRYYQFGSLSESDYVQTDVLLRDLLIEYLDEMYESSLEDDTPVTPPTPPVVTPTTLTAPVVTISLEGVASWNVVTNASGYAYKINGGSEVSANALSVQLEDGDSIVVKALGNGTTYLDSAYSVAKTYTAPAVTIPTVTIAEFVSNFETYKSTVVTIKGYAYSCDNGGIYLEDGTANVYVNTAYENLYIGQEVTVTGNANAYYSCPRMVPTEPIVLSSTIKTITPPTTLTSIATIISENSSQSSMVYDHKVYRTSGVVKYLGGKYCLVDGEDTNKLQLSGTVSTADVDQFASYLGKEIEINIVIYDYFLTSTTFRFVPLRNLENIVVIGEGELEDPDAEPGRVETTIADLLSSKPTEHKSVIYVVTATWILDTDNINAPTYGNGWLEDESGNQVKVYGLCSEASVAVWNGSSYDYSNNRSYSTSGIESGDKLVVGMLYDTGYDNYNCFFISFAEEEETTENTVVNFIQINDTHGAFADSKEGYSIGRVDTLVTTLESLKGNYIFIHGGDAFQGSYVSGETHGLVLIEALNQMSLDCFVIGNHEFDWGLDVISAYADGNSANGEANFPFLGANIFYAGTTTRPDWIDAYTIVETDGVKVGIIGIMGFGQESSILTRHVKDYYFADPLPIVSSTASYLRTTEECDLVVVATHDYNYDFNVSVGNLSGDSIIDGIFTAHTHQNVKEYVQRSDGKEIAVVQSLHKNNQASTISITLDTEYNYTSSTYNSYAPGNYSISTRVQTIINKYQYLLDEGEEVIGNTSVALDKTALGGHVTEAMLDYSYTNNTFGDIDVSIINTGGVRATIDNGDITRAEVFEVFPFDNIVVIVNMSGLAIKNLVSENSGYVYTGESDTLVEVNDTTIYQVAVVDYVYENKYYAGYFEGFQSIVTNVLMRELFMDYIDTNNALF